HHHAEHAAHGHAHHGGPVDEAGDAAQGQAMDHAAHSRAAHHGEAHDAHAHAGGHGAHVDHTGHETMFRNRFWVSLLLRIPVLILSPMLQDWFGFRPPEFTGDRWVGAGFAIVIFFYGGVPFLQMAVPELRNRKP